PCSRALLRPTDPAPHRRCDRGSPPRLTSCGMILSPRADGRRPALTKGTGNDTQLPSVRTTLIVPRAQPVCYFTVFAVGLHFTMRLAGLTWLRAIGSYAEDACLY